MPLTHRALPTRLPEPQRRIVLHLQHCDCPECTPPASHTGLSVAEISWWSLAGIGIGNVAAFAIDPHGSWHALAAMARSILGIGQ